MYMYMCYQIPKFQNYFAFFKSFFDILTVFHLSFLKIWYNRRQNHTHMQIETNSNSLTINRTLQFQLYCLFPLTFPSVHLIRNGRTDKCGNTSEPHTLLTIHFKWDSFGSCVNKNCQTHRCTKTLGRLFSKIYTIILKKLKSHPVWFYFRIY